ncbi:MAG: BatD family protein [Proteobacteria bacterium]|nr:BatD family protein [Pseudomonadota bacterium]
MRRRFSGLILASLWLFAAAVHAAPEEPSVEFSFDRDTFVAGEPFEMNISVTADGEGEPTIHIPDTRGLRVLQRSVSRPSSGMSFSFSFGLGQGAKKVVRNTGTTRHQLFVVADAPGAYRVGPVEVTLDGHRFRVGTRTINVVAAGAAKAVSPDAADAAASLGGQPLVLQNVKRDPDYFLHMSVSKDSVYLGEMVVLSVYLYTRTSNLRIEQFTREPGTDGFWVERFEDFDLRRIQTESVVVEGQRMDRLLLKQMPLFPIKTGELVIAAPTLSFTVGGGFFSFGRQVTRSAEPVTVQVKPLPTTGQPAAFHPDNVGHFRLKAELSPNPARVGEPVTFQLVLEGEGNVRKAALPVLPTIGGLRAYPPEEGVTVKAAKQRVTGTRSHKVLLIPEAAGEYTIPALSMPVFHPGTAQYQVLKTREFKLAVREGASGAAALPAPPADAGAAATDDAAGVASTANRDAFSRMQTQLRSISNRINVDRGAPLAVTRPLYLGLLGGVLLLFVGFGVGRWAHRRWSLRREVNRPSRAAPEAIRALRQLGAQSGALERDAFYAALHKTLLAYLASRLDVTVVGDTQTELSARLVQHGMPAPQVAEFMTLLESCEFARFARVDADAADFRAEIDHAISLVRALSQGRGTPSAAGAPAQGGGDA